MVGIGGSFVREVFRRSLEHISILFIFEMMFITKWIFKNSSDTNQKEKGKLPAGTCIAPEQIYSKTLSEAKLCGEVIYGLQIVHIIDSL